MSMSLESALDEERREILKLLEGPAQLPPTRPAAAPTPAIHRLLDEHARTSSPQGARSPVRSMLDIVEPLPTTRRASIAGAGVGPTPALSDPARNGRPIRSMLDPSPRRSMLDPSPRRSMLDPSPRRSMLDPSPRRSMLDSSPRRSTLDLSPRRSMLIPSPIRNMLDSVSKPLPHPSAKSNAMSPTEVHRPDSASLHRSRSDAAAHPHPSSGPFPLRDRESMNANRGSVFTPNQDFQFEMIPNHSVGTLPKRVTLGGKRPSLMPSSMAGVMGKDPGPGRKRETRNRPPTSRSPPSRFGRSRSPHANLNTNSFNPMPTPGKFVGQSGQLVDMETAYRRLSDVYLARSSGSLSALPARRNIEKHIRANSGETLSPNGGVRLQKDYYLDGSHELAVEESSDDLSDGSSIDELSTGFRRGRGRSRRKGAADGEDSDASTVSKGVETTLGMGQAKGPRQAQSLLAAAEEERRQVSSKYKVRSLLAAPLAEPGPSIERPKKVGVHPSTSFDQGIAGGTTPMTSDTEAENCDIRRAQRMHVGISPITSTPDSHRVIRTIIRGEYAKILKDAEEGHRRQRSYLVATDLSDEAAHALEWTIGTVLRDGDTLLAMYAVNEETGTGKSGEESQSGLGIGIGIGDGALALKDQAALIGSLSVKPPHAPPSPSPLALSGLIAAGQQSVSASPDSRQRSKAEQERFHAAEDISERCVRLLRKTRLQVRVVIEVIHCKSPKHLITEVIDFIDPTLVILGSRGRSALKGVLLGSFSNYLVTKSSVPVMVARRKLKKHSKKYKDTNIRLSNNLLPSKGLASAKID